MMKAEWSKIYLSLCFARSRDDQSLEAFVIDKSKQEGVYVKLALHLNENTLLSVVIINAVSMVAYRATKQQIIDGYDMNSSISHITMRHCDVDDETAEKMSQYFSKSSTVTAAFIGCTFYNFGHRIIFNGFSCINTLQILFFNYANIDKSTAIALSMVISSNTKLYMIELFSCNLRQYAGIVAGALKNISTVKTLTLSENKIPGSIADDIAIAIYVNC